MQELSGFHGLFGRKDPEQVGAAIDAAAMASDMSPASAVDGDRLSRVYHRSGYPPVDVACDLTGESAQIVVGPLERSVVEAWGGDELAGLLTRFCRGLDVVLGRSFRGGGGGHGLVKPEELTGLLEFVDWYQYLAAPIVARWGASYLDAGPFYQTASLDDGSMVVLLGADPFEGLLSRKNAAEYLGIRLRPLYGKDFEGRPIQLEWK